MPLANYYMNLPFDLSGSIAKNRFRNEILWGLKKMFDLYKEDIEFTVVFDYSCDIEVHKENCFEFYQVKTQNDNGTYTVNKLTKKNKSGDSVIGKLYKLKYNPSGDECEETKVALVSNVPLNDGKKVHNNFEMVELNKIDQKAIVLIKKCIKDELNLKKDISLENADFIKTGMDLVNPEKTLIGETVLFFEEKFNCEPKKVNTLYRLLQSEVFNKASFELQLTNYDEVLKKKGINKEFLDEVLNKYIENTDTAVDEVRRFIGKQFENNFKARLKLNTALMQVSSSLRSNKQLKNIEGQIVEYIQDQIDILPESDIEIVEHISEKMYYLKTPEISKEELQVLILLVLKRLEEGVYE
ncbi:dsDNA nuclease domain-containing protein [Bacillus sp. TE8-1]|uniref:dsDNA nuclease domain-containing protein n=1 Tax=Bacillus sp. TE8-1 TaxID=2217829 RepID=UPI0011EF7400|nr:dsDNA nuclease domain-containing protein [Bacillus sp. TE8-1]KAA0761721.1 DUF4297 domain-containing protein [Bacillus sp. TE8-1]